MSRWVETVERVIPAPPERIFSLVADPRRHKDIDGSGTVRDATDLPHQLTLGSTFGMKMEFGGACTLTSTVIEHDAGRRIARQSRPPQDSARWRHLFGGRIWRYELVTATHDVAAESAAATKEPPATPDAPSGPGSRPEQTQGRVPLADYSNGRAAKGYYCNARQVSHIGNTGGFKTFRYVDTAG